MTMMYLIGLVAWAVPTVAGIWYLRAFHDLHQEVKLLRRLLQEIHQRREENRGE